MIQLFDLRNKKVLIEAFLIHGIFGFLMFVFKENISTLIFLFR
jgi:hypothetical protein